MASKRALGVSQLWGTLRRRMTSLGQRVYWDVRDIFSRPREVLESRAVRFRVLFVCLGNVCRSPLAEEIFRRKVAEAGLAGVVGIDSAATSAWNIGKRPHWKARACAARHGLALGHLRARLLTPSDLDRFDRILVMDQRNLQDVLGLAPQPQVAARVRLLLDFAGGGEIPDPIHGEAADFERVFCQIDGACDGLLTTVAQEIERRTATTAVRTRL